MGILRTFAGWAVAGDKLLKTQSFSVGVVDFFEFVADAFEQGFLYEAGDTNANFIAVAGFDDFSSGVVVGKNYAIFPNEFAVN